MHIISAPFSGSCFRSSFSEESAVASQNKRYCTHWRMIPALFALSSFVLAVTTALFFNKRYLCLAHLPGGVGGLYLLYIAWQIPYLKTFEQNNVDMGLSLVDLKNQNEKLTEEVDTFSDANKTLKAQVSRLKIQERALSREVSSFKQENQTLNAEVTRFQTLNTEVAGTMQDLTTNLEKLGQDAETNHQKLGDDLDNLQTVIQQLKQTTDHLKEAQTSNTGALKDQLEALNRILELIQTVLEPMKRWKDEKSIQQLMTLHRDMSEEHTRLIVQCNGLQTEASNLNKHNQILKLHGEQLSEAVRSLAKIVGELNHHDQTLVQTFEKAMQFANTLEKITQHDT